MAKLENLKLEQLISPNPYAYVDNENYKNIVNMGPVAIGILDTKYQQGEIANSSLTLDEKAEAFRDYGIFGQAYVELIMEKDTENMEKIGFVHDKYINKLEGESFIPEISKNELKK